MGDKDPIRVIVVFNLCPPPLVRSTIFLQLFLRNVFMLDWLWSLQFANRVCLLDAATSLGVGGIMLDWQKKRRRLCDIACTPSASWTLLSAAMT